MFNHFNAGASLITSDGRIFFGGNNGYNRFKPSSIKDNPYIPPVIITPNFIYLKKPYYMDTIIMSKNVIELKYNQNFFAFEYAALNYILPEKNQYAYMLEGLEKDWIYCGTRRDRQYTDLDRVHINSE
ncbi:MAG: triple tyrosine motif-containing protein [Bacteroidia bacterium]